MLLLSFLLQLASAGQIPVPPIFTPCTFPSPVYDQHEHRMTCTTISRLPFICDLHHQLSYANLAGIELAYERYKPYFYQNNRTTLAVLIVLKSHSVRQLEAPTSAASVYEEQSYACLFENECNRVDSEVVLGFVNNVKIFIKVYAWKVYERWFALDDSCTRPNVLALMVLDGLINDARKIPYVRIHTGEPRLRFALGNIASEANNALVQGWPLQKAIEDMVDDIGHALRELHELKGEPRDHSVPRWARHAFLICFALVILALMVEWYIVRRKLGVQKSGQIKISAGKSKTHLMF
ncbi:hypothetical protein NECAME_01160 [Necator americanus]|uniref:Uncharacterized protein n=1 Tax=Necator americanus TaxID=51031 RepID=W2SHG3_NECAM|nr:hypothetical protein NECAME_01160 [Necator americanus]ETN69050.1 hypothetical protein NECAME_01160 [Necator americanus]